MFGNSKDEIKRLETNNMLDLNLDNKLVFVGAVSGLSGGITNYTFNKENQLVHMSYVYHTTDETYSFRSSRILESQKKINEIRKALLEGIKKKYGTPQYREDAQQNVSCGTEFTGLIKNALTYESYYDPYFSKPSNDLQAWILPEKNGYVIISLHWTTLEDRLRCKTENVVELGYLYVSNEDYNIMMESQRAQEALIREEKAKKEAAFLNDL